jgi:hypothetical protein
MGSTPEAILAGRQWRRPKTQESERDDDLSQKEVIFLEILSRSNARDATDCREVLAEREYVLYFYLTV